ncbi:MAG: ABC transporter permease [Eubacteriales bacterium]|nr:ABC transporter permease [Eubacteriales bacterium]
MRRYILKRVFAILVTIFIIITVTFFLMRIAPGSPFSQEKAIPEKILQTLNEAYGLDNPWYIQFKDYLVDILHFNFGTSMKHRYITTNQMIGEGFPVSALLGVEAILLAVSIGLLVGTVAALHHNKWQDYTMNVLAVLGISVPSFIMASILQYLFAIKLNVFPIGGWQSFSYSLLPAITLSLSPMAYIAKLTRSSMLEQMNSEHVKLAIAKGMPGKRVVFRHALRNAVMPVVTYLGPLTAAIITGSVIIENIFGIPGLGKYFVTSITNRDYPVIMGTTVFYSIILLSAILIVDILYGFIDPRIKLKGGK